MNKNNLEIIENFLSLSVNNTLLINQVSEEIYFFYIFVIKEFANKFNIKITYDTKINNFDISNDLFETKEVIIFNFSSAKIIEEVASKAFKKIIFTDYKNYKKLVHKYETVNSYNFEKDLKNFLIKYNNINDDELFNYCLSYPYLTYSELSKYKLNKSNYPIEPIKANNSNFILQIRKEIFLLKKNKMNIKDLFMELKKEANYKKFNFLTY